MNVANSKACFVDANIIFYIHDVAAVEEFPNILEKVYNQVFIHREVINELSIDGKKFVQKKMDEGKWIKFEETLISEIQMIEYRQLITNISTKLKEIDEARGKVDSMGTGEIYSLAAATVMNAEFICSNDYSVQNVIESLSLQVYPGGDEELEPVLLKQHRFVELCALVCEKEVLKRGQVYKGFKTALRKIKIDNREEYDKLISEFKTMIPVTS